MESPRARVRSLLTVLALTVLAFGAFLGTAPRARAAYVGGDIATDTTWGPANSTYVMYAHVTVLPGATLTILPGVTVKVDPLRILFVQGRLVADGNASSPVGWLANNTLSPLPPLGIQFNATATGSVSWNAFTGFDRPLAAADSAPTFSHNTITTAGTAIALIRSAATVADNTITYAQTGIAASESSAQIVRNAIDVVQAGIQLSGLGTSYLGGNQVTNVTSSLAIGIYVYGGASANLWLNTVRYVQGMPGAAGAIPGSDGGAGGLAAGILIDGAPSTVAVLNTVDQIAGGRGGDGTNNPGGTGGAGGAGGDAVAIGVGRPPTVQLTGNFLGNLYGGRGGTGGGSPGGLTAQGGPGGIGGNAFAIELILGTTTTKCESNVIGGDWGGIGGDGGYGTALDGRGGGGGQAIGIFTLAAMGTNASGNFIQNLHGGFGGNSTAAGAGNNRGGDGGDAIGISVNGNPGSSVLDQNTAWTVVGGSGGRGVGGGTGGNATSITIVGIPDGRFNDTQVAGNNLIAPTGGTGGIGQRVGGGGGVGAGLALAYVTATTGRNRASTVRGGDGGDAIDGTDGGRGGDAYGFLAYMVADSWSSQDVTNGVTKGAVGFGPPAQASLGIGWVLYGNASSPTRTTIENNTLGGTGDLDLQLNDDVAATTVNTSFSEAKLSIVATSTLTVRNFLGIDALWPNGATAIPGAQVYVTDEGSPVWDLASATGRERWLLVTDRVYEGTIPARDNRTEATVSYSSYSFANDPRTVDMAVSNVQRFVMVDVDAPTATAGPLPTYRNAAAFSVPYTAADGNGVGIGNVTLWWRKGGGWTPFATQPGAAGGTFAFTATAGDGTYEFAATAEDRAGNREPNPGTNETWTVLDTIRPGSHVDAQPPWRTTATFPVTWAPDGGVTDIASYAIEVNHDGAGWTTWTVATAGTTSADFTANPPSGVYAFRSIATDAAGNVEVAPGTNDTWTIVDTSPPNSTVLALPAYETSLTFPVSWGPVGGSDDIGSYRIEVRDNGAGWSVWIPSAPGTSASFTGVDGHAYEFRSIATDYAGNAESAKAGNDTWTHVDATPPDSRVAALPPYSTALAWTLTWGPVAGTTDIATYSVEYRDDGGSWTPVPGATATSATTASFALGVDGRTYGFRSIATDRAGNVEPANAGNDTWTHVDTTPPAVLASAPRGTGTNTTPTIQVTFSEPMDRASAEAAFSITPDINGAFAWSADSRTMTFIPARTLAASTEYSLAVDSSARDLAGNAMLQPATFQFTTAAPPGGGGPSAGGLGEWWWILAVVVAAVLGTLLVAMRLLRSRAAPQPVAATKPMGDSTIEDVFLLYRDGILIKHETRRLKPDIDTDILSGMLTAVQSFVKDSFRSEEGELDEMTFGEMHILLGRGKWLILAAMIQGDGSPSMRGQIEACIGEMEAAHPDRIEKWDGNMAIAKVLSPYVKKLIRGDYAPANP